MKTLKTILSILAVYAVFVLGFMSIAHYHNLPNHYCDDVRTNYPDRMEYLDYQVFCNDK